MMKSHFEHVEDIAYHVDKHIIDINDKKDKREYIGGSALGSPCIRQIQYRYMQTPPDTTRAFSARTLRIFDMGHIVEEIMAGYLTKAGFDIKTHDKKGEQFGFSVAEGKIKGHIDGVVCSGPVAMPYPFLWENKSANNKKFNEFVRKGVEKANPAYAGQIAVYQAYMDLTENPALFTVYNKDTSDIYYEFVPFNKILAQRMSDNGVEIIQATDANELLPRVAANSDFYSCKFCEYHNTCWNEKN